MRRARSLPLIVAVLAVSLALMGCGLVSPAVRIFTEPTATRTPRVIERVVTVEVPQRQERPQEPAPQQVQRLPSRACAAASLSSTRADAETVILTASIRRSVRQSSASST